MVHLLKILVLCLLVSFGKSIGPDACSTPCHCFYRKGEFYVSCIDTEIDEFPINIPAKTQRLYLQGNSFTDIGISNTFEYLPELEVLFLHNNAALTNVSASAFENLPNLKMVLMHYTMIYEIPNGLFSNNSLLEYIWLDHSDIHVVGDSVFDGLSNVKELFLNDNSIPELYAGQFQSLNSLARLQLQGNDLTTPSCCQMCGVPQWTHIDLNVADETIDCACDTSVCTRNNGSTFTMDQCYPQKSSVCPSYIFNSASRSMGYVRMTIVSLLLGATLLTVR